MGLMHPLLSHLFKPSDETQFIFSLFHLLLAGLTLLVLFHQLRENGNQKAQRAGQILTWGFLLFALDFAFLTLYFGTNFYFRRHLGWSGFGTLSQGLMASGLLLIAASYLEDYGKVIRRPLHRAIGACGVLTALVAGDLILSRTNIPVFQRIHTPTNLFIALLSLVGLGVALWVVLKNRSTGWRASVLALSALAIALILNVLPTFLPGGKVLLWNAEQHTLSVSLFAFAWMAGERSGNLLDRVFVRLNLTFILLASLIMLAIVSMQQYQYLRLAEERSMNLAEYLRGHITYYRSHGESLVEIFQRPALVKEVVTEFGRLPELREVNVFFDGQELSFRYLPDREIKERIIPTVGGSKSVGEPVKDSFAMIRLPLGIGASRHNQIELVGTTKYIDENTGKYIVLIYLLFTAFVALATGAIGITVNDADRRLKLQYAELQEAQQQLGQAAKLASIGELAGGMAHEINTPITSILSLSSHLAEGKNSATLTSGQRRMLKLVAEQAERVAAVVSNLLTFSRQSPMEFESVRIVDVLERAIALVQFRFKSGNIGLQREISNGLPPIPGNPSRLTEVFVNLLNNSIDSMPQGGRLTIRAFGIRDPECGVRVEVSDTGCGISPEILDEIFDPFFTTKKPGKGTGLGLSISHGIVKKHHGQIWVRSTAGHGSTFVVILPKETDRNADRTHISDRR